MNLLMLTQDFPPAVGGIERYSAQLATRFASRAQKFAVIAPFKKRHSDFDTRQDYPVHRIMTPNTWLPVLSIPQAMRLSHRHQISATFHAQWQTVLAAKLVRPDKIFVAVHGRELLLEPFYGNSNRLINFRKVRDALLRKVDVFFPVSEYTAGLLRSTGISDSRICVVGNGIDASHFFPQDVTTFCQSMELAGKKVILTVARLVKRKGLDTLLHALPLVLARAKEVVLLIGGTGPERKNLERLVQKNGLENRVRFLGRIPEDDLPRYFNVCDVFALPPRPSSTDVEGFGIVFLEANACGKPVVGTRTGGIPDAVEHGKTGLMVETDNPVELANAILQLLENEDLAKKLGLSGLERVRKTGNWDVVAQRIYSRMEQGLLC